MFKDRGNPCGLFTPGHFILLISTLLIIILLLYISRNLDKKKIKHISKIAILIISQLELIKILFNFIYGYFNVENWAPISYCATFIPAMYLASFGKGKLEEIGDSFISCCFIAGLAFLIFPTTSLTEVPAFHYLAVYSFLYHGAMFYFGIIYLFKINNTITKKDLLGHLILVFSMSFIAIFINTIWDRNLMFLRRTPYLPITIIVNILNKLNIFYTPVVVLLYTILPFTCAFLLSKFKKKEKQTTEEKIYA